MKSVQLSGSLRANVGKVNAKAVREKGNVPCVIYGEGEQIHFSADKTKAREVQAKFAAKYNDVNTYEEYQQPNFVINVGDFKTKLEAAGAIARQLRLRNLGGIVIADFIDMVREDHREAVLEEFRKQLSKDRVKTQVSGYSALGLVEMTRKRTRESLAHMLCEPCAVCEGKGIVKTARTVCYDILREILREARQFNPREFRVVAAPAVIDIFLDEESQHLAGLSDFIGKPISLRSEGAMAQEQYDIVLL